MDYISRVCVALAMAWASPPAAPPSHDGTSIAVPVEVERLLSTLAPAAAKQLMSRAACEALREVRKNYREKKKIDTMRHATTGLSPTPPPAGGTSETSGNVVGRSSEVGRAWTAAVRRFARLEAARGGGARLAGCGWSSKSSACDAPCFRHPFCPCR